MKSRRAFALCAMLLLGAFAAQAAIQTPEQFFGFRIGADRKLARYDKIIDYFQKIAADSARVRYRNLGQTTLGNPFVMLEISSEDNIRRLETLKGLERKLYFQGGAPTDAERDEIFRSGKAVIFVTNNIHSTEIGSSQMVIELVYRLATDDSPAVRKVLENVILLLVPSLNPDGQMMVTDWYNKYVGTPHEASPMPWLYHPYTGHDNNRDWYLFSQKESRLAAGVLWHEWFPAIWLDEHQQGNSGPRVFTMPATDPINPNVDPLIYRLNALYGQSQAAALEAEGKTGIIYNSTYTNYWEGAAAWAGWWHNQVGLLTEVASVRIATPVVQRMADPSRPAAPAAADARGAGLGGQDQDPNAPLPPPRDITPRTEYPKPWLGGKWTLRDIVDYELTATFALLETAADRRETLLRQIYDINRNTIEAGRKGEIGGGRDKFFGVLIPVAGQHDGNEAVELVNTLMAGGVEVYRARDAFKQDGKSYPAGTFVIPFTQVFARYAKDILERQTYPEVRRASNAPPEAPYDVSAWSLGMQFGVKVDFAKTPLDPSLASERVTAPPRYTLEASRQGNSWRFAYNGALSALVVNRLLKAGAKVSVTKPEGGNAPFVVAEADQAAWTKAVDGFDVRNAATGAAPAAAAAPLKAPRIGIYQSWQPSMDEGWMRWIFDRYEFEYTKLHNEDVRAGNLRQRFDVILLPDQRANSILDGSNDRTQVAEYKGGIGDAGWEALRRFVADGGTLVALGEATNLLVSKLPLGVKDLKRSLTREQHFAPGTIVSVQVDTTNPIGWGAAGDTYGFYNNSPFFQLVEGFASQKVTVVARYPNADVRASGWLRGEEFMNGRAAVVTVEMNPGKIVLFGLRPQFRAGTHATLPLLFNALYWSVE
jgi:hypothetical protein